MKNIALITAKGTNLSIANKNLIKVERKSFLAWQIVAAQNAKLIDEIFVLTDDEKIKKEARKYKATIIDCPSELAQPSTNHGDPIIYGARKAKYILKNNINIVTILLGNTSKNRGEDIDICITKLINNLDADSSMTVWKAQDDHPYRAMSIGETGYLKSFIEVNNLDSNRQTYPAVYFYDQGPWCVRYNSLLKCNRNINGPACWWWMGKNCIPVVRNWVTGKDVHSQLDVEIDRCWKKFNLWKY